MTDRFLVWTGPDNVLYTVTAERVLTGNDAWGPHTLEPAWFLTYLAADRPRLRCALHSDELPVTEALAASRWSLAYMNSTGRIWMGSE